MKSFQIVSNINSVNFVKVMNYEKLSDLFPMYSKKQI